MQAVSSDHCIEVNTVRRWVRRFKDFSDKHEGRISKTSAALAEIYWSAWWFCRKIIIQLWK
jgi:hypothetical protein